MGLQKKHGKGRLDKWYKLAKEKGYRARAAFKLIQLNKKYNILEKSRVLLDLCAAPGSWCQVAAETMPANALIIGVDLAPIKPIPRVISFQSDITSDKCRATIRQHLKTLKADTVLHDGAPNVGTAWVQDAFSQAELVLQSLKLATEFLAEGGSFVTKIFRSKDYNSLLWVFNQLFSKVEATKPPSSRTVSAEIFVVCRGFKAPKRIDPKFLDSRSVFAELSDPTPNNEAKVFNPEKKKRKREGYEEGDYIQFKEAPVSEFIQTTDPIAMLGSLNKLSFEQSSNGDIALAALDRLPETDREIRDCCADLKTLGRKDFRILLKWRLKVREKFGFGSKKTQKESQATEEVAEIEPFDEELQAQEDLKRLSEEASSKTKRERRKENEKKQRELTRMQLNMTVPTDIGLEHATLTGEDSMFAIKALKSAGVSTQIARGRMGYMRPPGNQTATNGAGSATESESDPEEDQLDRDLDSMYDQYRARKSDADAKFRAKQARTEHGDGVWEGFSSPDPGSESEGWEEESNESSLDGEVSGAGEGKPNPRNDNLGASKDGLTKRAALFFDQEIFKDFNGVGDEDDADGGIEPESAIDDATASQTKQRDINTFISQPDGPVESSWSPLANGHGQDDANVSNASGSPAISSDDDERGFEIVRSVKDVETDETREPLKNGRLDIDIITAEAMTLAQKLASGETTRDELINDGFNKLTFRDTDGLPEWFLDDETKHNKPNRPITAAGAAAIQEKLRAMNARPIKKVREAKDRKRFKAGQKLEKLRRKSALLAEDEGMSEKDKAQSIARLMSRAAKKKPKQQVKVVVARGGNRGISGRPKGVKGKYKIVDARLKKDVRAEKRIAKRKK
ncbi:MAG: AdoMet-dependent rRNA methyltransferase spb1 [Piccolia ochrophora]|nr:MAG: AdoMet-dependent rRNA methyltransferase spb1 [Piccolia ochrophora]